MAAEISDVATPPDHAEQQDGNPNTPSVVVLQPAAQPWGGDAESDCPPSTSFGPVPRAFAGHGHQRSRLSEDLGFMELEPSAAGSDPLSAAGSDPLRGAGSGSPNAPGSPLDSEDGEVELVNTGTIRIHEGGVLIRPTIPFDDTLGGQGAHMRTISALSGIDPGEADAHGLLSDPSLLSLSLSQQPTTAQSTPVAISFKTHTNHHLVPALTQLLKQILEFEYLDDQGTSDPSIESPLNSVLDRLSAVAEDEKEAISVSEQAMDELESDIRSLSEWRMENFRLLKVAGDRRGGDSGPAGALKTMELDDLISENKCLWEKIEAQQLSIKHLQAADWGRERNIQGKDHLIEVLKAQKLVLEQKIKRLAARTGLRAYTTPAPGRESAHHTC